MEHPRSILVVDDEPNIRLLIGTVLQNNGFRVNQAEEGSRALALLRAERPDLILLDWEMRGVGGGEFLRLLRAEGEPVPPIMVISGSADSDCVKRYPEVKDFLGKPFDLEELERRVRLLLNLNGEGSPAGGGEPPPGEDST